MSLDLTERVGGGRYCDINSARCWNELSEAINEPGEHEIDLMPRDDHGVAMWYRELSLELHCSGSPSFRCPVESPYRTWCTPRCCRASAACAVLHYGPGGGVGFGGRVGG